MGFEDMDWIELAQVRDNNNNNNNNNNKLQMGCHPVAMVILHVFYI